MRSALRTLWTAIVALLLPALLVLAAPELARAQLMIIGNDEKVSWDDAGKVVFAAPGKDTVSIVDIANREAPRIVASLPLMNSIFGPPTNLAITPDERLAIVANSMNWVQEGGAWKAVPDNKIYVIDLKASPPAHLATVEGGKQPSRVSVFLIAGSIRTRSASLPGAWLLLARGEAHPAEVDVRGRAAEDHPAWEEMRLTGAQGSPQILLTLAKQRRATMTEERGCRIASFNSTLAAWKYI